MDFCLRLLAHGWFVRLGTGDAIIHHETPSRDWSRMDFYGRRNDIIFAWRNVPMPYMPTHLVATTLNGLRWAFIRGSTRMLLGVGSAYKDIILNRCECCPVSKRAYRLHRILRKKGPRVLQEVAQLL
jgi:hypothetical protein